MREDFDNRKSPPGDVRRMEGAISANSVSTVGIISLMIAALLGGLPVAVWLDLNSLAETNLLRQAGDLNSLVSSVRGYYAANVVGRVLASPGVATQVAPNYKTIPGAIPIPATLSLELGRVISEQQQNIADKAIFAKLNQLPLQTQPGRIVEGSEWENRDHEIRPRDFANE